MSNVKFTTPLALVLLLLFTTCCNVVQPKASGTDHLSLQKYKDATIAFIAEDADGDAHTYCTGFFIGDNTILTADHCVRGALKMQVVAENGEEILPIIDAVLPMIDVEGFKMSYTTEREMPILNQNPVSSYVGEVLYDDVSRDLALLKTVEDVPFHRTLSISNEDPNLGDDVVMVGHPDNMSWSIAFGKVSAIRPEINGFSKRGPFLQLNIGTIPGNSGGPIINQDGQVVGILSFSGKGYESYGFAIHRQSIHTFLIEAKEAKSAKGKKHSHQ